MKLLYPFGILESSRSGMDPRKSQFNVVGMMALPRTPMDTHVVDTETDKDAEDIVDVSSLPPG